MDHGTRNEWVGRAAANVADAAGSQHAAANVAGSAGGELAAPQGPFELLLIAIMISVVWFTLIRCVIYLLRPGAVSARHAKRRVLQ